jgi:hypothetical protein
MTEPLYRLVYVSRNCIGGDGAGLRREVESILHTARALNARHGITGALLFNEHCFAQVLEGGLDAVQETFERIQCDARHDEAVVLSMEAVGGREFAGWSMAFEGDRSPALATFDELTASADLDPASLDGAQVLDLLVRHVRREAASA